MEKSFQENVYATVARIPRGKVATYGQIAALARAPRNARAVGALMRTASAPNLLYHRVIGAGGSLGGYSSEYGKHTKRKKLEEEGVVFKGIKVDMKVSGWSQSKIYRTVSSS